MNYYPVNRYDLPGDIAGETITPTFAEIYENDEAFLAAYKNGMFPETISTESCRTLYYLLYARYGNEEIADTVDINQWQARVMATVFQYAPAWEKKLEIQSKIRSWNEDQILEGAEETYNMAQHPGKATPEDGIIKSINAQNRSLRKKDKMSAYSYLSALLETDITEELLIRFAPLFNPFSGIKSRVHYFTTEEEEI
jgi:hypothetical protein